MHLYQRLLLALTTGYIAFFFNERIFWSMPRPEDTLLGFILGWLLYSVFAYMCLVVVQSFKIRSIWALFLVAALFGWLVEGLFALTTFGINFPFPFSIPWTALAWHAPAFLLGWYGMLRVLSSSTLNTFLATLALGVFWGTWSLAWPINTGDEVFVTSDIYLLHGLISTTFYILALHLFHRLGIKDFAASKAEKIVLGFIALALFAGYTIPGAIPIVGFLLPLTLLPVLFGLLYLGLWKNKRVETEANAFTLVDSHIPFLRSLILLLAPCIAALIFNSGLYMNTNIAWMLVLTPCGTIIFIVSLYKVLRRQQ